MTTDHILESILWINWNYYTIKGKTKHKNKGCVKQHIFRWSSCDIKLWGTGLVLVHEKKPLY